MNILMYISDYLVPFIVLSIVVYGVMNGVNVYESFIKGAKSGFLTVIRLMPTLIGLMAAVGILRASGFLDFIADAIGQFSGLIGFPGELVPLTVVKMFSSSAATGLLLDIFKEFGTDSRIGLIASISLCCTETIFYTMSVYFMTAGVKHSRYTLAGAPPLHSPDSRQVCSLQIFFFLWDCRSFPFVLKYLYRITEYAVFCVIKDMEVSLWQA